MTFPAKVLLVDDEPHVRKYIGLILRSLGSTTLLEASDGAEGFAIYQREKPDLVLLDVNMPGVDGIAALKSITTFDPDAAVIMLTSLANRQTVEEAADSGALLYLRKDTPRAELAALLKDTFSGEPATE